LFLMRTLLFLPSNPNPNTSILLMSSTFSFLAFFLSLNNEHFQNFIFLCNHFDSLKTIRTDLSKHRFNVKANKLAQSLLNVLIKSNCYIYYFNL
jgi:hypothetical protein